MKKLIILLALLMPYNAYAVLGYFSWIPPTTNCDLSSITDFAGYVILWGYDFGGPYPYEQHIDDAFATSAVVDFGQVSGATIYAVIVSINIHGNRSDDIGGCGYSNEKTFPFPAIPPGPSDQLNGCGSIGWFGFVVGPFLPRIRRRRRES